MYTLLEIFTSLGFLMILAVLFAVGFIYLLVKSILRGFRLKKNTRAYIISCSSTDGLSLKLIVRENDSLKALEKFKKRFPGIKWEDIKAGEIIE